MFHMCKQQIRRSAAYPHTLFGAFIVQFQDSEISLSLLYLNFQKSRTLQRSRPVRVKNGEKPEDRLSRSAA